MNLPKGFDRVALVLLLAIASIELRAQNIIVNAETRDIQATLSRTVNNVDQPIDNTGTGENPNEYFTFNEGSLRNPVGFADPAQIMNEVRFRALPRTGAIALTQWVLHNQSPQLPTEKYIRKYHFGTWVNDPYDNSCLNTRAKVLVRDSQRPVTYKPNNHCVVDGGLWNDPYTGRQFNSSKDIQIDHVVPLKHAFVTGAFRWDYKTRCHYANFLDNSYHLIAVNGHENMSKGDKSPDEYMPPNYRVACGYLQRWLEIKLAWQLVIFPREAQAISSYVQKFRCNPADFSMDRNELMRQRIAMSQNLPSCMKAPTLPVPALNN